MFWLITACILALLTIILVIAANSRHGEEWQAIGAFCVGMTLLPILIFNLISGPTFHDECINNSEKCPIKVKYVQFHKFFDNTIDELILLPDQAVLLKNVQIIAKDKLPEDFGL